MVKIIPIYVRLVSIKQVAHFEGTSLAFRAHTVRGILPTMQSHLPMRRTIAAGFSGILREEPVQNRVGVSLGFCGDLNAEGHAYGASRREILKLAECDQPSHLRNRDESLRQRRQNPDAPTPDMSQGHPQGTYGILSTPFRVFLQLRLTLRFYRHHFHGLASAFLHDSGAFPTGEVDRINTANRISRPAIPRCGCRG
jgi:hypothetical protein